MEQVYTFLQKVQHLFLDEVPECNYSQLASGIESSVVCSLSSS